MAFRGLSWIIVPGLGLASLPPQTSAPAMAPAEPRPLILGHRGYSAHYLENSAEAFRGALDAGMDGFELDAQLSADGVSCVLHDDDFRRTALGCGRLRRMATARFPRLRNGEKVPLLSEILGLPSPLVVELKGAPGWQQALEAVRATGALERVVFSSFDHAEIHQLRQACPEARCGLLWDRPAALCLSAADLDRLDPGLTLHLPLDAVRARPDFWRTHAPRLVLWGMGNPSEVANLGFQPAALIVDGL